jgi:nucleoside-diphosphate-sugar epimerase
MIERGWFFFMGERGAIANYIHVENVIDALVLCGTADLPANGRTYIVSDFCRLEEFVAIIATALGIPCPKKRLPENLVRNVAHLADYLPSFPLRSSRIDALTYRHCYNTERIRSELAFNNKISMQEGIGELVRHAKR